MSRPAVAFFKLIRQMRRPMSGALPSPRLKLATSGSGIFNTNQADGRVDGRFHEQELHLLGRYTYFGVALSGNPYFGAAGGLGYGAGGFAGTDSARYQSVAAGGDYVVSSTWLTDFPALATIVSTTTPSGPDSDQPLAMT